MSEQRKLNIEKLKKQREYLMNPQNIDLLKKREENVENHTNSNEKNKTLSFKNGNIKGFETPYNEYRKNGYVDVLLLSIFTFLFETLFLFISYVIFR